MTGRPAWTPTNSICEQAREMAPNGLTVAQIADCLGVYESTLYVEDVQPRDLEKTSITQSVTSESSKITQNHYHCTSYPYMYT